MGKAHDLTDFDRGMIVGARRAGCSITETAEFLGFSRTTVSRVYREWCEKGRARSNRHFCGRKPLVDEKEERRMASLLHANGECTTAQLTSLYNIDAPRGISERTARRTLRRMGYRWVLPLFEMQHAVLSSCPEGQGVEGAVCKTEETPSPVTPLNNT